jgi:phosphate transport system substrate-binding protein
VADGTYQPLARPIFIYVSKKDSNRPEIAAFINYYLEKGAPLVKETGYIPLSQKATQLVAKRFTAGTTGSLFDGNGSTVGATVEMLLEGK